MTETSLLAGLLSHFFHMGGYGWYVWTAYGGVFLYLLVQWFVPWWRWHQYRREQMAKREHTS